MRDTKLSVNLIYLFYFKKTFLSALLGITQGLTHARQTLYLLRLILSHLYSVLRQDSINFSWAGFKLIILLSSSPDGWDSIISCLMRH
jgi:hypothetical protein